MALSGPIIIIDDDIDDQEILETVFASLQIENPTVFFSSCEEALRYLETTTDKPFIILCDINLPRMNGFELRQKINEDQFLREKSIPFVFWSTTAHPDAVKKAYDLTVQGFFKKKGNMQDIADEVRIVLDYWKSCVHPNSK